MFWSLDQQKELGRLDRRWQKIYLALTTENQRRRDLGKPLLDAKPAILSNAKAALRYTAKQRDAALAKPHRIAQLTWLIGIGLVASGLAMHFFRTANLSDSEQVELP